MIGHRVGRINATTANTVQANPNAVTGVEKAPKLKRPLTLMGTKSLHSKTIAKRDRLSDVLFLKLTTANEAAYRMSGLQSL